MKRAFLVAIVIALVGANTAAARTKVVCPVSCGAGYQRWIHEAKMPTPNVTLSIVEDDSPCEGPTACTGPGKFTIWLQPWGGSRLTHQTFLHEIGHNFDYYEMTEWSRARFESLIGETRPWTEDPNAPNEKFAEAWRWCAMHGPKLARAPLDFAYGYRPTPLLQARACHLIQKVAHGSGLGISR